MRGIISRIREQSVESRGDLGREMKRSEESRDRGIFGGEAHEYGLREPRTLSRGKTVQVRGDVCVFLFLYIIFP